MRTKFIAGNWKMHKTVSESVELAQSLLESLASGKHKYMIAPSFTALDAVSKVLSGSSILLGAQNMSSEEKGAHTGEVSVLQLVDIGVQVVILGHSERRHTYGESDELINKKIKLALAHGLEVIICIGELLEEREAGNAEKVCERQLKTAFLGIPSKDLTKITIAYEPVWAIGTGKTATPEDADAIHQYVRSVIASLYSDSEAESMIIQYGGSMKADNAVALLAKENIDGGLIGGASLSADTFVPIALA